MTLKKITVIANVENEEEVKIVREWIEKWKPKFRHCKDKGCGCCVFSYDILVPSSAVGELPEKVLAWSDWSKPEVLNKK